MMIGLLIGFVIVGPIFCYLIGMANPIGWMGVPPWQVPRCTCTQQRVPGLHDPGSCAIARGPRR